MAPQNENVDNDMKWPDQNEVAFLKILYGRIKKNPNVTPSFKRSDWLQMDNELLPISGESYGPQRLQGKYNRLRHKYRLFSELLGHTGVSYDITTNTMFAHEDVWQMFYKKNKIYKSLKKNGCKNYELLGQVFKKSTASEHHHASTHSHPTSDDHLLPISDDETQNEIEFLNRDVRINDLEHSSGGNTSKGKWSADEITTELNHGSSPKSARLEELDSCLDIWASSLNVKSDRYLAKMKRNEQESTTTMSTDILDPYSIEKCMRISLSFPNVSHKAIVMAGKEFMNSDWRKVFVCMPTETQEWWIKSLG